MPGVKEQVIDLVKSLPEDATLDDVMAEIYLKAQVDEGLKQLDEDKGLDEEEVKNLLSQWLGT